MSLNNSRPLIYFFCFSYKDEKDIEAIKKEAKTYFNEFSKSFRDFEYRFVSLESDLQDNVEIYDENENVYYWSYNFSELISRHNPGLIHIFHDDLDAYQLFERNYDTDSRVTLFNVTGMEPLKRTDEQFLEHLSHAIDVGNLQIISQSEAVRENLSTYGLRSTFMNNFSNIQWGEAKKKRNGNFTIGFASSPMTSDTWVQRGMDLILELASICRGYTFKISWRSNETEKLYQEIKKRDLTNLHVHEGYLNMVDFYSDIDTIILPYVTYENNHSSPLSLIESLILGIPAIVTNVVGLARLVETYGMGVTGEPNVDSLKDCIEKLAENYDEYLNNTSKYGRELFYLNSENKLRYFKLYKNLTAQEAAPKLGEWRRMLEETGKYLVCGKVGMKEYYNDKFIAENYDEDRFVDYPMRTYNRLEKSAIHFFIKNFTPGSNLSILDIASGEGRILEELVGYGKCTAVENSSFMISVSAKKLSGKGKLVYVKEDIFDFETTEKFDVITIFRFIRHYNYSDRKKIYKKLFESLSANGIIICDFPNKLVEGQLRNRYQWHVFNVYDAFWHMNEILDELSDNGFKLIHNIPVGELLLPSDRVGDLMEPLANIVCFGKENR
ncbi:methyltransferase domain-containing protein [Fontibacillus sp. BL9]|uniref:methyltransferase domain-containing protein n=1 Tax=Fontibacillus sp. BL9 TaxID=3389971 RepID=UPI0039796EEF